MPQPIPTGHHTITPIFVFKDSLKAIDFYKKAFGAQEQGVTPGPGGRGVMHAALKIGDSMVMMSDENPHNPMKSAETLGTSPVSFYLYVPDVDAAFARATAAGATVQMAVQEAFWGDRVGSVSDPFGHTWMLATHTRDLSPEEIQKGAEAMYATAGKKE